MQRTPFIWLGSRRAKRRGIGGEAGLLDAAAASALPVPQGAVLLDEFYRLLLAEDALKLSGPKVLLSDPQIVSDVLFEAVRFPRLHRPVVLRPAFTPPSGIVDLVPAPTVPRHSATLLTPGQLTAALAAIYDAAILWEAGIGADPGTVRRDLLIMEIVEESAAGKATTKAGSQSDWVQYEGHGPAQSHELPRLRPWRRPDKEIPPQEQRLQQLLRGIRRTFKDEGWSIEWADDGRICWLISINPLPVSGQGESP